MYGIVYQVSGLHLPGTLRTEMLKFSMTACIYVASMDEFR